MKFLVITFLFFIFLHTFGQTAMAEFDAKTWESPYYLPTPQDWAIERFLIPIAFASHIPYKGVEDIRFAAGWNNVKSEAYWSYAFLWYLDGTPNINAKIIQNNLKAYYTGLVDVMKGESDELVIVQSKIIKVKTDKGDIKTFRGTIYMLDYMAHKPITLNFIIHLKRCATQSKTYLFHEISPKPYNDNIWKSLGQLWTEFSCSKAE